MQIERDGFNSSDGTMAKPTPLLCQTSPAVLDLCLIHACWALQVFRVLGREGVNVKMMSQGASKNNISLIVADAEGKAVVQALHNEFF